MIRPLRIAEIERVGAEPVGAAAGRGAGFPQESRMPAVAQAIEPQLLGVHSSFPTLRFGRGWQFPVCWQSACFEGVVFSFLLFAGLVYVSNRNTSNRL